MALLVATFAAWTTSVSATPTGSIQNINYNAGTTTLSWDLVLNNDATAVAGASIAFPAPGTARANTTAGGGSCTGLPAGTPITCSIPANGSLTISFSVRVLQLCSAQAITVGPYTISGGGVAGTVTVPRTAANVPPTATCLGILSPAVYNTGTQALTWQIPTDPGTPGGNITYTIGTASQEPNCAFLVTGGPNPLPCPNGAAGHTPSVDTAVTITAASPAGICGALPRTIAAGTTGDCTIPPNSPAGSISLSAAMAQTCSEFVGSSSAYAVLGSPLQPANITIYPGSYQGVPGNFALCPATPAPTPTQIPGGPNAPTATPTAIATATPLVPVVLPVIPQVFQNPNAIPAIMGGIGNGTRNNTPVPARPVSIDPAAVAPATAMPVLRPPSTGDAGLHGTP